MRILFPVLVLAALLSGCSSKILLDPICPQTGFIDKANTITYLAPGTTDIVVKGSIKSYSGECKFKDKKTNTVDVSLTLPFIAQRGKAGATLKDYELPYFIAVLSPDEQILQRSAFTTKISFNNDGVGSSTEDHVIEIPLPSRTEAGKYKVVIGFALTPEQYKYNGESHK